MKEAKQVLVVRRDLKMRRGKEIAQGAHASIAFLTNKLRHNGAVSLLQLPDYQVNWLLGHFKKVTCQVDTEAELLDVFEKAKAAGLEAHLITDSGATEFHGENTNTVVAIGPNLAEEVDPITGHLKLY